MAEGRILRADSAKPLYLQVDPAWKGVIRWGGLSLFGAAVCLVIFVVAVFSLQQTLPVPAQEALENPTAPAMLFLLAAIGELLLMPAGLGLYFSLKDVRKTPMLIATALWLLAVPFFLASRGLLISLSQISDRYMSTSNATMKAAYLASAELALETENIYSAMALILLSIASIIMGVVMLKGGFGRLISAVVIAAGACSVFSPFGVTLGIGPIVISFIGLVLSAAWQLVVGAKLYRLGKET